PPRGADAAKKDCAVIRLNRHGPAPSLHSGRRGRRNAEQDWFVADWPIRLAGPIQAIQPLSRRVEETGAFRSGSGYRCLRVEDRRGRIG
ncbi:MAG: hypothetical protein ACE5E1_07720, partial [Phycisphaerae bacterium]